MNKPKVSPFAPASFPSLPPVAGLSLAAGACGIRYKGRADLMLAELAPGTTVAGVFTRSSTASAPVDWCRKVLPGGKARALVVNSGIANAFTGAEGDRTVERTAAAAAALLGCAPEDIFIASTGVIGDPLDPAKIEAALPRLKDQLSADPAAWEPAARAIMTTDTFPKAAFARARLGSGRATIAGFVKGSGMIAPNMATMLGFIFTDAKLPAPLLQRMLSRAAEATFNCITVDSDTSTSDTVLLFATGRGPASSAKSADAPELADFSSKLQAVCLELAHLVIKDGEGATKFITVKVEGGADNTSAKRIGLAIANSPLVKTALAAGDANWGRIVMAIGKSGEPVERSRIGISIGGTVIAARGGRVPDYDEAPVARHMKGSEILIEIEVGAGKGRATVWTCDLTHDYISINADYRS